MRLRAIRQAFTRVYLRLIIFVDLFQLLNIGVLAVDAELFLVIDELLLGLEF